MREITVDGSRLAVAHHSRAVPVTPPERPRCQDRFHTNQIKAVRIRIDRFDKPCI
jgi:hypothetical protein